MVLDRVESSQIPHFREYLGLVIDFGKVYKKESKMILHYDFLLMLDPSKR